MDEPFAMMLTIAVCASGFALAGAFAWLWLRDRRRAQGGAGRVEDLAVLERAAQRELEAAGALDAASAHMAVLDEAGRIVSVNQAWRDFAIENKLPDPAACIGTDYLAVCDGASGPSSEEAQPVARALRQVLSGERSSAYVEYPCHAPHEQRWFQLRARRFELAGRARVLVWHENITEAKTAERRVREGQSELAHTARLALMGEMASGLAHEINQPMSAIVNYCRGSVRRLEALSGTPGVSEVIEAMRSCAEESHRVSEIIKRMRAFARKRPLRLEPGDVGAAVRDAMTLASSDAERRGVKLRLVVDNGPVVASIDAVGVQQVVINLVRNGAEATQAAQAKGVVGARLGGGAVEVRVRASCNRVLVEVEDWGEVVDATTLSRLFEPYFTTKPDGTGLGLAISESIAQAHGGTLRGAAKPAGGMVFTLALVRVEASALGAGGTREVRMVGGGLVEGVCADQSGS